jgi:hypothetical protein
MPHAVIKAGAFYFMYAGISENRMADITVCGKKFLQY